MYPVLKVFKFYWISSSSINNSSVGLGYAGRIRGSVGETSSGYGL